MARKRKFQKKMVELGTHRGGPGRLLGEINVTFSIKEMWPEILNSKYVFHVEIKCKVR